MAINRDLIIAKLECAFHQAKARGLRISNTGWGVSRSKTKCWELAPFGDYGSDGKKVYILAFLIEGRPSRTSENGSAAKVLGLTDGQMQTFSNGFCSGPSLRLYDTFKKESESWDDDQFLYRLGQYLKSKL